MQYNTPEDYVQQKKATKDFCLHCIILLQFLT